VHLIKLLDPLFKSILIFSWVVTDLKFVPPTAHPALVAVSPETTLLDLIMTQDTSKNHLVHIPCHGVLIEDLVSDLIYSHKHQSQFSLGPVLLFFDQLFLSTLPLSFNFELLLLTKSVTASGLSFGVWLVLLGGPD